VTTIVYRDGLMACDSRGYSGSRSPIGTKIKMKRLEDGTLIGVSSTIPGGGEAVIQWYEAGALPNVDAIFFPDSFTMLAIKPNGAGYFADNHPVLSGPLKAPYYAAGSGGEFALGALEFGADAFSAIQIACKLDPFSDMPIVASSHTGDAPPTVDLADPFLIWID